MARALCESGHYSWDEFREYLIESIGSADAENFEYFLCFQEALTRLLDSKSLCDPGELRSRESELAARPHGHDHDH